LYLNPPSSGGLCDGVTTMPSARGPSVSRLWVRIAWEMSVVAVDHDLDAVPGEHLDDRVQRRGGQRVGVTAEEERAVDALLGAVPADGCGDRDDVVLVERPLQRRAAVPGRAERDALRRIGRVGTLVVVRAEQRIHVDEDRRIRQLPGYGRHDPPDASHRRS
jgi:hypothetical protein